LQTALVPFTETLRLAEAVPPAVRRSVTITRLIGHAKMGEAGSPQTPVGVAREVWRFARTVRQLVGSLAAT